MASGDFAVGLDLVVHQPFNGFDLGIADRLAVGEVEAQPVGVHQRATLLNMIAEHPAQGRVQQVGGRVVGADQPAPFGVHFRGHWIPHAQFALGHLADVQVLVAAGDGVQDLKTDAAVAKRAGIAHLAAGFSVERCLVEDRNALRTLADGLDGIPRRVEERHDLASAGTALVAQKLHLGVDPHLLPQGKVEARRRPAPLPLALHFGFEARQVNGQAPFAGDVGGKVGGKAVGVVELEEDLARNALVVLACQRPFEQFHALAERFGKALFLGQQRALYVSQLLHQQRIGFAHFSGQIVGQLVEERLLNLQLVAVTQPAADDAAQHIGPILVARRHAIGNEKGARPEVVGNDPQGRIGEYRFAAADACEFARPPHEARKQVNLKVAVYALQHGGHALKAHAGIDSWRGQRLKLAIGGTVELREHQVPHLDVTVAVLVGGPRRTTGHFGAVVVEDLRARAARAGVAHRPEVVAMVHHALRPNADLVAPQAAAFIVGGVHGDPKTLLGQLEFVGHERPSPSDGLLLEVVAKTEIAEHFEKSQVASGVADVFEIVVLAPGAHAALRGDGPLVAGVLSAKQGVLELVHAGVGEQQGRIVTRH